MEKARRNGNGSSAAGSIRVRPQGILVLGMHRSGTSALARVLNLLGCALSDQLLGPGSGNETGHWESLEALALNDEMLASAGSSHDDWGPINDDWRKSAIRSQMIERASAILESHAALGPLFAIKDPRMCRLADVWLAASNAVEIDPLVLLVVRNPTEVSASLESRDLMTPGYAELLWLRHVIDAEYLTRGQKRVVCRYDQLMANWQGLVTQIKHGLGITLPRNSPKAHAEIEGFLSQSQRHHFAEPSAVLSNPAHLEWLRQTFQVMLDWSEEGEKASDYPVLDEVRAELNRAYATFARFLMPLGFTGNAGSGQQLRKEVASLREENERKNEALQLAKSASEEWRISAAQREAELAARIDAEASLAQSLQAENAQLRTEVEHLSAEIASRKALSESAAQQEAELAARIDAEASLARSLQTENDQLRTEVEHLSAEIASRAASGEEAVRLLKNELEGRTIELKQVQSAMADAAAEACHQRQRLEEAEDRVATALRELHDEQIRNAEVAGQVSALQSALLQRQEELAQLLASFREAEQARVRAEIAHEQEREHRVRFEQQLKKADAEINKLQADLEQSILAANLKAESLATDLAQVTVLLQKQEEAAEQAERERAQSAAEASRLSEEVRRLGETVVRAETARAEAESKLGARFDELARLTSILALETDRAEALESQAQWLSAVRRLEDGFPVWWAIMPKAWRRQRAHRRYYRAGLFDAEAYLALYPDVAAASMDPVRHYILHGMAEGRVRTTPT